MGKIEGFDANCVSNILSRREFCEYGLLSWLAASASFTVLGSAAQALTAIDGTADLHKAMFYKRLRNGRVQCLLCPNRCIRSHGESGKCRVRANRQGEYYSLVYGKPSVIALDEVAKCPLNHFELPEKVFSIATAGCNLSCLYCQNWEFSQSGPDQVSKVYNLMPRDVVSKAIQNNAAAIAYFYTEPTIYYEYMIDIAKIAHDKGIKNIMVTAGYINTEPLRKLLPHLDAVVLGLKGWNKQYYQKYIGGELKHVINTVETLASQDRTWWEVVNLIVPSLNDNMDDIAAMSHWLYQIAGPTRPLHFTRFRAEYKLRRLPKTPAATLTAARNIAMQAGLQYVYAGNMPGHDGANTFCPKCKKMIVERFGFTVTDKKIDNGRCVYCGHKIEGVWL